MFENADAYSIPICKKCGSMAIPKQKLSHAQNEAECGVCNSRGDDAISEVCVPYSFKLFMQELQGMNIDMRVFQESSGGASVNA